MDAHLGRGRHERGGGGNARNGTRSKTLVTEVGPVVVAVPRDRDGSLAPQVVANSPLGHGFLTGQIRSPEQLADDDWRKTNPRFTGANLQRNLRIVDEVKAVADAVGGGVLLDAGDPLGAGDRGDVFALGEQLVSLVSG
jgi:hypothetical protein